MSPLVDPGRCELGCDGDDAGGRGSWTHGGKPRAGNAIDRRIGGTSSQSRCFATITDESHVGACPRTETHKVHAFARV